MVGWDDDGFYPQVLLCEFCCAIFSTKFYTFTYFSGIWKHACQFYSYQPKIACQPKFMKQQLGCNALVWENLLFNKLLVCHKFWCMLIISPQAKQQYWNNNKDKKNWMCVMWENLYTAPAAWYTITGLQFETIITTKMHCLLLCW